jgi:hypothetical protein
LTCLSLLSDLQVLQSANLSGANMRGAILPGAHMAWAQLHQASAPRVKDAASQSRCATSPIESIESLWNGPENSHFVGQAGRPTRSTYKIEPFLPGVRHPSPDSLDVESRQHVALRGRADVIPCEPSNFSHVGHPGDVLTHPHLVLSRLRSQSRSR